MVVLRGKDWEEGVGGRVGRQRSWRVGVGLREKFTCQSIDLANVCLYHSLMLATQDAWPIDVPEAFVDTRDRGERLIAKAHVIDLMRLSLAEEAAEFAATDDYQDDGAATSIDWIRINCHMTGPAAADLVAVGEHVAELPRSVDALADGHIGFGHLVVMSRTASALASSATAPAFDERRFLNTALEN